MAVRPLPHRFTVEDYNRMTEAGILGEDDRVELLEGEIVEMTPIGRHAACVHRLNEVLTSQAAGRAIVLVQNPVRLGELSEPQPDLATAEVAGRLLRGRHPGPADELLIIEVAETSGT